LPDEAIFLFFINNIKVMFFFFVFFHFVFFLKNIKKSYILLNL
jgi:hypothetical protein